MSRNNFAFKKRFSVASREAVPPLRNAFYNIPLHNKMLRGVRWCWINFHCRGVLIIWIIVGQGPTALAVGVGGVRHFFSLFFLPLLSPSLWETTRYRLKYCLKGPLSPNNLPTNKTLRALVFSNSFQNK